MCVGTSSTYENQGEYVPETELMVLCSSAYQKYQCEIINGSKRYCRYVKDFIYSHVLIASHKQSDWEIHAKNLLTLHELLDDRPDLVRKFFSKKTFTASDYEAMMYEFNHSEPTRSASPDILGFFTVKQIEFITDFVNDNGLLNDHVTTEQMSDFFSCKQDSPLTPTNIGRFAMLLDNLRAKGLLVYAWQEIIMNHGLLLSPSNGKKLKSKNISARLSEYKQRHGTTNLAFTAMVNEVKSMQETESK